MSDYKAGDSVTVAVQITIPADATREEVQEWLDFSLGCRGSIAVTHPLADYDAEASDVLIQC